MAHCARPLDGQRTVWPRLSVDVDVDCVACCCFASPSTRFVAKSENACYQQMTPSCALHTVHSGPPPSLPSLSWLITGRPQHVANLVAWQRPPHCFNGHFNAPSSPQPPSRSRLLCLFLLSLLLLLPLPRRPACRLPHVRSCMFFFSKNFFAAAF